MWPNPSPKPLWSRLLAPGVFKPSYSTPFTLFLHLVSVYWPFQLYFIPKILSTIPLFSAPFLQLMTNQPFSCIYLQHSSSLYNSSYSLRSPSDLACLLCTAFCVGGGWDPGGWGPLWGPTHFFGPDFPLTGVWVGPTQSVGWSCFVLISIRRQRLRVNQGIEVNFVLVLLPEYIVFWALVRTCWNATCVHPLVGLGGRWGQNIMNLSET